mmetsp:Transcript_24870/g.50474  ORF Transcript_24870/g.50474 Transcript_24870/m.50474 type:complete len:207 (+) Transcript_24870:131-751(+)
MTRVCTKSRIDFCVLFLSPEALYSLRSTPLCVELTCLTAFASNTPSKMKPKRSSHCSSCSLATAMRALTASSVSSPCSMAPLICWQMARFSSSNSSGSSSLCPAAFSTFVYASSCALRRAATAASDVSTAQSSSSSSSSPRISRLTSRNLASFSLKSGSNWKKSSPSSRSKSSSRDNSCVIWSSASTKSSSGITPGCSAKCPLRTA